MIVVYDSGVGATSVIDALCRRLPDVATFKIADPRSFPYGSRCQSEITERFVAATQRIAEEVIPFAWVIACNTLSIACRNIDVRLPMLPSATFTMLNAGVKCGEHAPGKRLAILGTALTVRSCFLRQAIEIRRPDLSIEQFALTDLAIGIERNEANSVEDVRAWMRDKYAGIKRFDPDTILLVCTHFPLAGRFLAQLFPCARFIDPSEELSIEIIKHLQKRSLNKKCAPIRVNTLRELENMGFDCRFCAKSERVA